ncbi:MAG: HAMP domain-containing sensor histidine kinase [Spirochaetaceae bacterium]|nr:HAMP domain-containing sensor histidine kinase [Spirochaetaceae bacterium]
MAAAGGLPFLSIRARLVLSFILIAMVAIGIVGGFSGALLKHFVERREAAYLQSNASTVARQARPLMVPVVRPLSLLELAQTSAFMSDSRIRIMDRAHRVLADSGPQDGSDHEWVRVVATFPSGNSMVRQMFWIRVSADPARRASQLRSLPALQGLADTQIMVVRRRSGLWGSLIEFREYDGPLAQPVATTGSAVPDDPMRITHLEPIGDPASPIGYVEIARSPDVHNEALETIIGPFIIAALAATVLAALLGLVFGRRLTAPIEGLTASAMRMGTGDLAARAPTTGSGEIGELGRQFNAMAGKLESTVRDLRQERDVLRRFVADASHELRTPVTALKTFNELLLRGARQDAGHGGAPHADGPPTDAARAALDNGRGPGAEAAPAAPVAVGEGVAAGDRKERGRGIDAPTRIEFLHDSRHQIERMEWIVENLLNLSRLEAGAFSNHAMRVTLGELVRGAERRFARHAARAGVAISVDLAPADGDLELHLAGMEIAVDNVMQNAILYGAGGREVVISGADDHGWATIRISDRGPGIAATDLPHVFERFYRGKPTADAGAAAKGSGLGLAIARAVVMANGGTIAAANNIDGPGASFSLRLPLRRISG